MADYYGRYEETFNLKVRRPARVTSVEPGFRIHLAGGETLTAEVIINATGTWDSPYIPYIPGSDTFQGRQLHTRDFTRASDFAGQRTLIVGGGLSAIQFLLELESITDVMWATRRPPEFTRKTVTPEWGRDVEDRVRSHIFAGQPPGSVVSNTGIPARSDYADGVVRGLLVSRGMFRTVTPTGVVFAGSTIPQRYGWNPLPAGTFQQFDTIFWNTGFRPNLKHLASLKLRNTQGGIPMRDEVTPTKNPRVLLAGYGSTASTVGATRAGRLAAQRALGELA